MVIGDVVVMDKKSQRKAIRKHLEDGWKLTALDALKLFGCMRLSARIYELRQSGLNVKKAMIVKYYEDGTCKRFAQYYLEKE